MPTKRKPQSKKTKAKRGGDIASDAFEAGVRWAIKHPRAVTTAIGIAGPAAYYGIGKAIQKVVKKVKK